MILVYLFAYSGSHGNLLAESHTVADRTSRVSFFSNPCDCNWEKAEESYISPEQQ